MTTWKISLEIPYLTTSDGTHTISEIRIPVTLDPGISIDTVSANNVVAFVSSTLLDAKKSGVRYIMSGHSIAECPVIKILVNHGCDSMAGSQ